MTPLARRLPIWVAWVVTALALVVALVVGVLIGPVSISPLAVAESLLPHLPLLHLHSHVPPLDAAIVWQLRAPRVVLAALVGAVLAGGGASYQGVFRNPLADPYLLGVAAGAGLGATIVIDSGSFSSLALPVAAFAGAVLAVAMTYSLGALGGRASEGVPGTSGRVVILAGVAVAALLTALQTYLQQRHTQQIQNIYDWLLGSFSSATWSDVTLVLPYIAVALVVLSLHRRYLDVMRVGEDEAGALGVHVARTRLVIVAAATLGTAAAVSVSGLIGFVGIIVPHLVRLLTRSSYRVILPLSMVGGAAFLVLADVVARTVESPTELPIGVVTAFVGAPFFLLVLRSRRAQHSAL